LKQEHTKAKNMTWTIKFHRVAVTTLLLATVGSSER
jgi:hypothetical protein